MGVEIPVLPFTLIAAADLSGSQYCFVNVNASGEAALAGAGTRAVGIVQNAPAAGQAAGIEALGVSICKAGAAVTAGDEVTSDASGRGITATTGNAVHGIALDDAGAADEFFTVLLHRKSAAAA